MEIKELDEFVDKKEKVLHTTEVMNSKKKYAIRNFEARVFRSLIDKQGWFKHKNSI
ncbi:MAG: hypothetical protein U9Q83_08000 [Bacteroidota bacterium]|nr:hypothetical protein [Bacteroidota bacterium]